MKAYWNDRGVGRAEDDAVEVDLEAARSIWYDEVRGVEGNFFGLIDDAGNTVQFYFAQGIPDDVDDAGHLRIVLMDFPLPQLQGSYGSRVTIAEVHGLVERAFSVGADHRKFEVVHFTPWESEQTDGPE